jgi:zinc-ribbon domain
MKYHWELDSGHQISIDNQGAQTIVTVWQSSVGQQQHTSSSFTTGTWSAPPEMTLTPTGAIVKIITASGESIVLIQGNSIQLQSSHQGDRRSSTSSSSSSTSSTQMPPMPPMEMGNMQMNMRPMTMRMGNMELNMDSTTSPKQFCTQCGSRINPTDKFCASCGHKLH